MILKTKTQKGFSLLELLLVVAVGAILILAGLAIYRNITNNTDVNEASRLINVIKQETQRIFQGEATYTGLTNNILTNADVIPAKYTSGEGIVTSPFDTAVTVEPFAADDTRFQVEMASVPPSGCIKLATQYTENDTDFVSVSIDGDAGDDTPTVAEASAACGADGNVDIIWVFE